VPTVRLPAIGTYRSRRCCNMPPKRASEDEPQLISKIQRIEHGVSTSPPPQHHALAANNDFSTSVKRKLADSKRTGQACDRCKVRTRLPCAHTKQCCFCARAFHGENAPLATTSIFCASRSHEVCAQTRCMAVARIAPASIASQKHQLTPPDPQDPLRWTARGMHAVRAEQDAMPDHRPHHRPRHGARPR
jgi:hypothetical protein